MESDPVRLEIADVLDRVTATDGWDDELWSRFHKLLGRTNVDGLLAYASEEFIHYSGEFNRRNLLLIRVKPDRHQVANYKEEFKQVASALREGTSWEEYKRVNSIYEMGSVTKALGRTLRRVRERFSR